MAAELGQDSLRKATRHALLTCHLVTFLARLFGYGVAALVQAAALAALVFDFAQGACLFASLLLCSSLDAKRLAAVLFAVILGVGIAYAAVVHTAATTLFTRTVATLADLCFLNACFAVARVWDFA